MKLGFNDIHGNEIEVGDLLLRDGAFIDLVGFDKGAFVMDTIDLYHQFDSFGNTPHVGLFYDNWARFKDQGLEIIAKNVV